MAAKVRSRSPAPISRTNASATSAATRSPCDFAVDRDRTTRIGRIAGNSPNSSAEVQPKSKAAASTRVVDGQFGDAWEAGHQGGERAQSRIGDGDCGETGDAGDCECFRHHESDDRGACCAEGQADVDLVLTGRAARQQEVRDVRAGDQQDERDGTQQQQQHRPLAARHALQEWNGLQTIVVPIGILAGQLRGGNGEFGLRGRQ